MYVCKYVHKYDMCTSLYASEHVCMCVCVTKTIGINAKVKKKCFQTKKKNTLTTNHFYTVNNRILFLQNNFLTEKCHFMQLA